MSPADVADPDLQAEAAIMADAAVGRNPSVDSADAVDATGPFDAPASTDPADSVDVVDSADAAAQLMRQRAEIERIDRAIVGLIAERVAVARKVGPLKQALGMPILDPPREAAIVRRAGELARDAGLPDEDVRYVFWHLVGLSRRVQLEEG